MTNEQKTTSADYLSPLEALAFAVEILGTQKDLARALGITQPAVSQMLAGTRPIPAIRARQVEQATGGKVRKEHLRPDVFADDCDCSAA